MRIIQVIASIAPRLGGPSKAVVEMSAALAARGHDVDLVTTPLTGRGSWLPLRESPTADGVQVGKRIAQDGYHITYCAATWPTRWATSGQMVSVLKSLASAADVIHIHSLYLFSTLVASRLAQARGIPYVLRPHGTLDPYIRRRHRLLKAIYHAIIEDRTLKNAAAIHFTSDEECRLAAPILPARTVSSVIPLGVNTLQYANLPERAAARASFGIPGDAFVPLFLGRLNHKKGLDILAPAFVQLARTLPNAWLALAGPDDDGLGEQFVQRCREAGVADRLIRPGLLDPARVRLAFAAADFLVLPSYSENFGVAVVEAMAAQLPVLITDNVNIWRAVQDAKAGIVTRAESPSIVEGMLALARLSPGERAAMGKRGRVLCQTTFSWEKTAQELTALYAQIVK